MPVVALRADRRQHRAARRALIQPGKTERALSDEIGVLAAELFGVTDHWHKRVVRCGRNTLQNASANPPELTLQPDDLVFLDFGPLFAEWEADEESRANGSTPPVFIVVCNNTNVSKAVFDYVAGYETEHQHPDTEPKVAPGAPKFSGCSISGWVTPGSAKK